MTSEEKKIKFIRKAQKKHENENLDYSQVVYVNSHTPVKIIDHSLRPDGTEYGEFWQAPSNHLKGQGHPDKRALKISQTKSSEQDEIIRRFKAAHPGENLDYSQVKYVNMHTKVKIISHDLRPDGTEYGEFWQEPIAHLRGCTHPDARARGRHRSPSNIRCNVNVKRDFVNTLLSANLGLTLPPTSSCFDVVNHTKKIGITFWGISEHMHQGDILKLMNAKSNGFTFIVIFEDEYLMHKDLVLDKLANILGLNANKPRAYARKCEIRELSDKTVVKDFLNKYHIQGFVGYTKAYGAYYNDTLVGVMTFLKEGEVWNLNRYTTDINYRCPGVASKLFSFFVKNCNPKTVKSFLDRRWCFNANTNLYTRLGFELVGALMPDYRYTNGHGERQHKFGFRKQILHRKYGLPLSMTESQMTESLGYYKIWDCGLLKYMWNAK